MKFILVLIIALAAINAQTDSDKIYETDFSDFVPYQTSTTSVVIQEDGIPVLSFPNTASRYTGVISPATWITSASGKYYITIQYKGTLNKRAGGYIGYERSDNPNIYKTIGLDNEISMDLYQIYRFNTTGEWNTYVAYLPLPQGVKIRIIFEKGNFNGVTGNYDAKFRYLKVFNYNLDSVSCPETGEKKLIQLYYFSFLFFNMDLDDKIFTESPLVDSTQSKGKLKFSYAHQFTGCVKTAFYGFNADGAVIEKFQPTYTKVVDIMSTNVDEIDFYEYIFTMNDIETLGCKSEEIQCTGKKCTKYTCNYALHFFYDYNKNFNTKQDSYTYTKDNSQAIFTNSFTVVVNKQESTVLNTYVKTLQVDKICTGICSLTLDLSLTLKIKTTKEGTYAVPTDGMTVTWGDYLYFQITSVPTDYKLKLLKIVATQNSETFELGELFMSSFLQNTKNSNKGEITFEMMIGAEAGLSLGKVFNLQFLMESTAATRRLLADTDLPQAALSGKISLTPVPNGDSAAKLALGFLILFLVLLMA